MSREDFSGSADSPVPSGLQSPEAILDGLSVQLDDTSMLPASLKPVYLFAFDQLMDQEYVARYVKGLIPAKVVSLPHHRLSWPYYYPPSGSCLPFPERTNQESDQIWGILYDARRSDLRPLERHLNVPGRYHKRGFIVQDRGGRRFTASAYVLSITSDTVAATEGPSPAFVARMLSAARERQLPPEWLLELEALQNSAAQQ